MTDTPTASLLDRPAGRYGESVPTTPTETAQRALQRAEQARLAYVTALTERDDAIAEMARSGMTAPGIARALGMSTTNVRHVLGPPRRRT